MEKLQKKPTKTSPETKQLQDQFKSITKSYLLLQNSNPPENDIADLYERFRQEFFIKPRNHRIITDSKIIQNKLEKQLAIAQIHRTCQKTHSRFLFQYVPFNPNSIEALGFQSYAAPRAIFQDLYCAVEIAQLLGKKPNQEDFFIASSFEIPIPKGATHTALLTGVLDGHGGSLTALSLQTKLPEKLQNTFISFFNETLEEDSPLKKLKNNNLLSNKLIWNVLKIACVELQEEFIKANQPSGTTATFSLLIDGKDLWHANIGDSRSFITSSEKTIQLSEDMKLRFSFSPHLTKAQFDARQADFNKTLPSIENPQIQSVKKTIQNLRFQIDKLKEKTTRRKANKSKANTLIATYKKEIKTREKRLKRLQKKEAPPKNNYEQSIWKRGGFTKNRKTGLRLNGYLAMARSLGDTRLGNNLCPRPKILKISLPETFQYSDSCILFHASDGVWDSATTNKMVQTIHDNIKTPLDQLAQNIAYSSVKTDRYDNVTVVILQIDLRALREKHSQIPQVHPSSK